MNSNRSSELWNVCWDSLLHVRIGQIYTTTKRCPSSKSKNMEKDPKQRQKFFSVILEESELYRDVVVKLESANKNTNLMAGVFCQALK